MRVDGYYIHTMSKERYIEEKIKILKSFGVVITKGIEDKMNALYPRDIAIENYIRKLVSDRLDK